MSDAIFSLLTTNASFDRTRFRKDFDAFHKRPETAPDTSANPLARFLSPATAQAAAEPAVPKAKKRKRAGEADAGEELNDDVHLFRAARADRKDAPTSSGAVETTRDPLEADNVLRKAHRIKVAGNLCPAPLRAFDELATVYGASRKVLRNLVAGGFAEPTPIQRQAIPCLLDSHDLFAVAPTGSGKTLAFLLPGVMKAMQLRKSEEATGIIMLVLNPTRELAAQTFRVFKLLSANTGVKGCLLSKPAAKGAQLDKVHVLVLAPMLLIQMIKDHRVNLADLRYLVLDEADKLFEMGFLEQIDAVFAACQQADLCRALFSATLPENVENAARSILQLPTRITVGERNSAVHTVKQKLLFVGKEEGKLLALKQMLAAGVKPPVLVFVASKERAQGLHEELKLDGVHVDCIHADQSQAKRAAAIDDFRAGKTWILIATDLVGRGMDFLGVNTVVNFDFPFSATDYIHRIGRTGRAGRTGEAVTFFLEENAGQLRAIANVMRAAGCEIPEWMLLLKKDAGAGSARGKAAKRTSRKGATAGKQGAPAAKAFVTLRGAAEAREAKRKEQIIRQSKDKKLRTLHTAARKTGSASAAARPRLPSTSAR